tara:strand:+ start:17851 stop:18105 length:255 start_codon:yes stop_codon:yes gene_type:complete
MIRSQHDSLERLGNFPGHQQVQQHNANKKLRAKLGSLLSEAFILRLKNRGSKVLPSILLQESEEQWAGVIEDVRQKTEGRPCGY